MKLLSHRLLCVAAGALLLVQARGSEQRDDGIHVFPGESIQEAIEQAALRKERKIVKVHAGEYRPAAMRPALIWFNRKHDGVTVEAVGPVTLSAQNPEIARKSSPSFPAIVNHVVYFGHGITSNTVLRGFVLTGGNGFATEKFQQVIEPDQSVPRNSFFVTDGGAIKVFGASGPLLEKLEIRDNFATPCAGGVSVQQQGLTNAPVIFRHCIFRNNRAQVTGAALDLLEGSAAVLENCLFVGNVANTGTDVVARRSGEKPFENSAALTIFQGSRAIVRNCTFTANRNGVDDMGGLSSYTDCIFSENTLPGGKSNLPRYELDLQKGGTVRNCSLRGTLLDPLGSVSSTDNVLQAADPAFDSKFWATNPAFRSVGFRPFE